MVILYIVIGVLIGVLAIGVLLYFLAIRPEKRMEMSKMAGLYAHRGLFGSDVAENSLTAFGLAADAGYGIELDVQLSHDGEVMVFHDTTLTRMCKVKGKISGRSAEELNRLHIKKTNDTIPYFSDALDVIGGRVRLIVELKTCKNYEELCKKTLMYLENYEGEYMIESFDPRIVRWFYKNAPHILRGQLACRMTKEEYKNPFMRVMLKGLMFNFFAHPNFIAYRLGDEGLGYKLSTGLYGAASAAWVVRKNSELDIERDIYIFEGFLPD